GPIDVSGGFCGGGSLDASATASLTTAGEINADSRSSGPGGDLALAGQSVSIGAAIHAIGLTLRGGSLTIDGCSIDVPAGLQLSTRGSQGSTILSASGA